MNIPYQLQLQQQLFILQQQRFAQLYFFPNPEEINNYYGKSMVETLFIHPYNLNYLNAIRNGRKIKEKLQDLYINLIIYLIINLDYNITMENYDGEFIITDVKYSMISIINFRNIKFQIENCKLKRKEIDEIIKKKFGNIDEIIDEETKKEIEKEREKEIKRITTNIMIDEMISLINQGYKDKVYIERKLKYKKIWIENITFNLFKKAKKWYYQKQNIIIDENKLLIELKIIKETIRIIGQTYRTQFTMYLKTFNNKFIDKIHFIENITKELIDTDDFRKIPYNCNWEPIEDLIQIL